MFRTPDLPTGQKKKFNEADFEEEKTWLKRKQEGKILTSKTEGGWTLAIGISIIIGLIIGATIGLLIAILTRNFLYLPISFFVVMGISLYILKGNFATVEIDPERGLLFYEGNISLGGELRSTRYRGPFQIVDRTLLVRFKRLIFFKTKPFIRFVTNSGYLRLNFKPKDDHEFFNALEELGLVNIEAMKNALNKPPVRVADDYVVYFEKRFDRTEFKAEMRRKREAEKHQEKIDQRIKRKKLIEKSKKFKQSEDEPTNQMETDSE